MLISDEPNRILRVFVNAKDPDWIHVEVFLVNRATGAVARRKLGIRETELVAILDALKQEKVESLE